MLKVTQVVNGRAGFDSKAGGLSRIRGNTSPILPASLTAHLLSLLTPSASERWLMPRKPPWALVNSKLLEGISL